MAEKVEQKESSRRRRPLGRRAEAVEETPQPVMEAAKGITAPKVRDTNRLRLKDRVDEVHFN